jgi:hypothetical protein
MRPVLLFLSAALLLWFASRLTGFWLAPLLYAMLLGTVVFAGVTFVKAVKMALGD